MWDVVEGWRQTVNGFEVFAKSIDFVPHASKLSAFWIKNWKLEKSGISLFLQIYPNNLQMNFQ